MGDPAAAAGHHARQVRLARDHFRRRIPIRPFGLARDLFHARPGKALAADADAVADRLAVAEHVIEKRVRCIDDDGAGHLVARIGDDLALQPRIELRVFIGRLLIGRVLRLREGLGLRGQRRDGEQRIGLRGAASKCSGGDERHRGDRFRDKHGCFPDQAS